MMKKRWALGVFVVLVCLVFVATATPAKAGDPVGTVKLKSSSIALGIGVNWGDGTLFFQGQEYKFSLSGLSVLDLGVSTVNAVGEVYDLKKPSDFAGTYTAAKAGIAIGAGAEGLTMINENDVVVNLRSTQVGVKLSLSLEGMSVTMK